MNNITFKSTRSKFFSIVVIITVLGLTGICISQLFNPDKGLPIHIPIQIICWLCIAFLLWVFFETKYQIDNNYISYKCGPIKGKIEINKIEEITVGQKIFVGFIPATGSNGLVIKYNRWDEIYISPNTNEDFIEAILKVNSSIKINNTNLVK
ncbi:PH domain-containing protein [Pedobacter mucosus]|uniref:PH domain-containing protein n=1 Tax=Pedobacter mucosus TaxID=2895286 RepID=UPI001EE468F1|nr:PH domain-containing protein [Pedobacter mucosus]UKT62916.1 PH domain-containing protein [Pedobacter mucosus]